MDGVPVTALLLLWRQVARSRGVKIGWDLEEIELLEWMKANGKKPGDDMTGFFDR